MTGRPPFRRSKCVCNICVCVYVLCLYIREETACVVPSTAVLCFPVDFDETKKGKSICVDVQQSFSSVLFFVSVLCTH